MVLINDILDLSSVERGDFTLHQQDVDMAALLEGLAAQYRSLANAKGLSLWLEKPDALPWLRGDADRLRQVLGNLLGNALKFTDEGQISLLVSLHKQDDGHARWQVAVQDTGMGMSAEQQARLFRVFEMADSSVTRRHGGTGVGLALCQRLAHAMQGEISVESQPGEGAASPSAGWPQRWRRRHSGRAAMRTLPCPSRYVRCGCWWPKTTPSTRS